MTSKVTAIVTLTCMVGCALNQGKFIERTFDPEGNVTEETRYTHTNATSAGAKQADGAGTMDYTWDQLTGNLQIGATVTEQQASSPFADLSTLLNVLLRFQATQNIYTPPPQDVPNDNR